MPSRDESPVLVDEAVHTLGNDNILHCQQVYCVHGRLLRLLQWTRFHTELRTLISYVIYCHYMRCETVCFPFMHVLDFFGWWELDQSPPLHRVNSRSMLSSRVVVPYR